VAVRSFSRSSRRPKILKLLIVQWESFAFLQFFFQIGAALATRGQKEEEKKKKIMMMKTKKCKVIETAAANSLSCSYVDFM
jgi:hypothetical protein